MGQVDLSYGPFGHPHMVLLVTPWLEAHRKRGPYEEVVIVAAHIICCALDAGPVRRFERPRDTLCGVWSNRQPLSFASIV
jgi:hypothetical protein